MKSQMVLAEMDAPEEWRGWAWPSDLTVGWFVDNTHYEVVGRMTATGPVIESVTITGDDIRAEHLREPVLSRFRAGFAQAANSSTGDTTRVSLHPGGRPPNPRAAKNRLDEVVKAYHGAPPRMKTKAVASDLGVSYSYARRLMSMARRAGLLR